MTRETKNEKKKNLSPVKYDTTFPVSSSADMRSVVGRCSRSYSADITTLRYTPWSNPCVSWWRVGIDTMTHQGRGRLGKGNSTFHWNQTYWCRNRLLAACLAFTNLGIVWITSWLRHNSEISRILKILRPEWHSPLSHRGGGDSGAATPLARHVTLAVMEKAQENCSTRLQCKVELTSLKLKTYSDWPLDHGTPRSDPARDSHAPASMLIKVS